MLLNLLRMRCLERFGGAHSEMMWILDEAPQYANRIQLDQLLDVVRGGNVSVVAGLQDVTQFGTEEAARRMLANCGALIGMRGLAPASAKYFSDRLGSRLAPATQHQPGSHGWSLPSSIGHQAMPVLGDRELMYPPVGEYGAVVHVPHASPLPWLCTFDVPG
jgi:type IV secretory pathway TraG/TraD family ATPase VirD4